MSADDAYLRRAEELLKEQIERYEGAVASVSCVPTEDGSASCEAVLSDGRTVAAVVGDVDKELQLAYFVMS